MGAKFSSWMGPVRIQRDSDVDLIGVPLALCGSSIVLCRRLKACRPPLPARDGSASQSESGLFRLSVAPPRGRFQLESCLFSGRSTAVSHLAHSWARFPTFSARGAGPPSPSPELGRMSLHRAATKTAREPPAGPTAGWRD